MSFSAVLTLAITFFVFGATPGPGIFAIIARALSAGFVSALALIFGLMVGDVVWLGLSAGGLAALAERFGQAFFILKILGGVYLAWLGIQAWRRPIALMTDAEPSPEATAVAKGESLGSVFMGGIVVNMSSPKSMVFYLAVLPSFIDPTTAGLAGTLKVLAVAMPVLLVVATSYAFTASRARHLFQSPVAMRWLNRVSGSMLMAVGAVVATRA